MKRLSVFASISLFAVFALAATAVAQQTTNITMQPATDNSGQFGMSANRPPEINVDQERQQLQNVVQQLDAAALRNDPSFFNRALAPDYVVSNADSREEHKSDIVTAHQQGDIKYDSIRLRDQNIDVIGDTALEHETADVRGTYKGQRFDGTYVTSRMWKRLPNGNWQIAAMQVRRVK